MQATMINDEDFIFIDAGTSTELMTTISAKSKLHLSPME